MWSYIQNNWALLIISALSPILAAYLVDLMRKWRENSWLYSLNKYLKLGANANRINSNPFVTELIQLFLLFVFMAGFLTFFYYALKQPWNNVYYLLLVLSVVSCVMMMWEHRPMKRDTKGLVGILSHNVKDVVPSRVDSSGNSDIFFATHELSYELRRPIYDEACISDIWERKIVAYYRELKTTINCEIEKKRVDKNLFYIEGRHICDYFPDEVYSISNLKTHISLVANSMQFDNSISFIGDKIGISGYELTKGILNLKIYLTDHFTFKVFKSIFLDRKYKESFQVIIRRINYATEREKELLVETLKFLFSSVGIDIVIHGRQANGKKGVLLALRNGGIERCNESKIHVPVNESFSKTDQQENSEIYDLRKCVTRGIEEELGISQDLIDSRCKFVFQDFAVVCDEGEIGLACYVDLSGCMPLEQARMYPGQDKYMEIKNLIVVDMPRFHVNADIYRNWFYQRTNNDVLCENWESFTPLLFQRFFLRTRKLSNAGLLTINYLVAVSVFLYVALLCGITPLAQPDFIVGGAITLLVGLIVSACSRSDKSHNLRKYRLFKPLVPQWGGDATVVQSTSSNIDKGLFEGMYFGCVTEPSVNLTKSLTELELIAPPYCKTRKEGVKNHTEVPISFYKMRVSDSINRDKKLIFREVPVAFDANDTLSVWLSVGFVNSRREYSFTKQIEAPVLKFEDGFKEEDLQSLCKYFSMSQEELKRYKIARITESLNKEESKCSAYRLLDMFLYQNNYYWIVRPNSLLGLSAASVVSVNKETDLFSDYIASLKEGKEFLLTGKSQDVISSLVRFISHKENRNRITALDIYALQLALIRYEYKQDNLVLAQIEPPYK